MSLPEIRRVAVAALAAGAAATSLVACSGSGSGGSSAAPTSGSSTTSASGSGSAGQANVANVTITSAKGCEVDSNSFPAGGITFKIVNKDATGVSEVELLSGERILGEKENVVAGLDGEFAVKADAGTYTLYCPGASSERSTITVTGQAAPVDNSLAALIKQGTQGYKAYVDNQMTYLLAATTKLVAAIRAGNLAQAQAAYIAARPYYEKVEPVAESFVNGKQNLDSDIDARVNDVPKGKWYGYHRIEKGLFADKSLQGLMPFATKLQADVTTLVGKAKSLTYSAPDLANGAQGLLDEVAAPDGKISGEEERYSHIDIVDMANNIEGSEQAFAQLEPAMKKIDPALTATISARFTALDTLVNKYRTSSNPSGYVLYSAVKDSDRRALAAAVKAVAEPLSRVAGKVANA